MAARAVGVHVVVRAVDGRVVIALEHDRAGRGKGHRGIDGEGRIGAVADEIAEKHEAIRLAGPRMGEAGLEAPPRLAWMSVRIATSIGGLVAQGEWQW